MTLKKHALIFCMVALFIAGLFPAAALSATSQDQGREQLTLSGGKTGSVEFPHRLHQTVVKDCQVCHKDFAQEKGALDAAKKAGDLKKKQVMNKTCITCHRAKKKAGEKTGPVSCNQCHKK